MKVRTIIFFLCLFLVPIILHAQKESKKHSYTLSGFYYPEYTYRFLDFKEQPTAALMNIIHKKELGKFGYSTGIIIGFQRNKWFTIKTGVCMSNMGYLTRPFFYDHIIYTYNYKYRIINIPLRASFNLFDYNSFTMTVELGLHPGIAISYKTSIENSNLNRSYYTYTERLYGMPIRVLASAEVDLGYKYRRWIFGLSGAYKMNLIHAKEKLCTNVDTYVYKKYTYSVGGGLSIGFAL